MAITAYYHASVADFISQSAEQILGLLTMEHHHALDEQQRWAWLQQISILKSSLPGHLDGRVFFELYIPRMGKRVDAALISRGIVFLMEFKAGATEHHASALHQVEDYALDLKNFHEGSHAVPIVPILVSTNAASQPIPKFQFANDDVAAPIATNSSDLRALLDSACSMLQFPPIDLEQWLSKGYRPTPTIVEAAQVLYRTHSVTDIARHDAGAKNLQQTNSSVSAIIDAARQHKKKAICFVTGVPGSGKTLAGLDIATRRSEEHVDEHAVFLSGNGPLVDVLREALARDKAERDQIPKSRADREVRSFVQNIHHFRDQYVGNERHTSRKSSGL